MTDDRQVLTRRSSSCYLVAVLGGLVVLGLVGWVVARLTGLAGSQVRPQRRARRPQPLAAQAPRRSSPSSASSSAPRRSSSLMAFGEGSHAGRPRRHQDARARPTSSSAASSRRTTPPPPAAVVRRHLRPQVRRPRTLLDPRRRRRPHGADARLPARSPLPANGSTRTAALVATTPEYTEVNQLALDQRPLPHARGRGDTCANTCVLGSGVGRQAVPVRGPARQDDRRSGPPLPRHRRHRRAACRPAAPAAARRPRTSTATSTSPSPPAAVRFGETVFTRTSGSRSRRAGPAQPGHADRRRRHRHVRRAGQGQGRRRRDQGAAEEEHLREGLRRHRPARPARGSRTAAGTLHQPARRHRLASRCSSAASAS